MSLYPNASGASPLLIKQLLDRPLAWAPNQKIIYRDLCEFTYREFADRVACLATLLRKLGVQPGDRVGVMDWDSHRYLELFFAVPMIGAVLHTINVRLAPEQIAFTIHHAEDRVLFFHTDFLPLVEQLTAHCPSITERVIMPDQGEPTATSLPIAGTYEDLLRQHPPVAEFPDFPEDTVATLFYTTGTTGQPKGVFFTHRQLVLHTITGGFTLAAYQDPVGIGYRDVYMPLTPMFHVHAWGVPYIATLLGIRQVYPGRYEPATLLRLVQEHRVSISHCVPTLLQMLLNALPNPGPDLSHWKIITGGAKLPSALARQAMAHGIRVAQGYGMSETCPIISASFYQPGMAEASLDERADILDRTGFPFPLVRARAVDANNHPLPPGPEHVGELVLQAPWLTTGYFKEPTKSEELWKSGWLHTGDLAYIDHDGYIRITDRLKDVIKIGGEWISSLSLENTLSRHEAVKEVAVIGVPDAKWDERPLALVVLDPAHTPAPTPKDLLNSLRPFIDDGSLHKRAILTRIELLEALPHTSVGKVDKRALRSQHRPATPSPPTTETEA